MNKFFFSFCCAFFILLYSSLFIVNDGHKAVILQFGKILKDNNQNIIFYFPGLHIKIPYLESIKIFDFRMQNTDNLGKWFITKDQKNIYVDACMKWKIINLNQFYAFSFNKDKKNITKLLKDYLNNFLYNTISHLNLNDIKLDSLSLFSIKQPFLLPLKINELKQCINKNINQKFIFKNNDINILGIQIIDIRINNIIFNESYFNSILLSMNNRLNHMIDYYRLSGVEEAEKIKSLTHIQATRILTMAKNKLIFFKKIVNFKFNQIFFSS
ncbi:Modulator of FtsH protease HflC [Buchnera aphidicola (Eriosoma grossulariae)]